MKFKSSLPPELKASVLSLIESGLSMKEVGLKLGITRNAVAGILYRAKPKTERKPRPITLKSWNRKHEAFLKMRPNQCRYPSEQEHKPPFTFCLKTVAPGSSYCPEHHKICNVVWRPFKRRNYYA